MGRELEGFGKPQQDGGLTDVRRQRPVSQGGSFEGPTPPVSPSRASSRSLKRSLGSLARGCAQPSRPGLCLQREGSELPTASCRAMFAFALSCW